MSTYELPLSEVLMFYSGDAECYRYCSECDTFVEVVTTGMYEEEDQGQCGHFYLGSRARYVYQVLSAKRNDPKYAYWRSVEREEKGSYDELCQDIYENGMNVPVILCGNEVYDGHHRIAAHEDLGLIKIKVRDAS